MRGNKTNHMPDISMCKNKTCPLRNTCYRFIAEPNPHRQVYAEFDWKVVDNGVVTCEYYWDSTSYKNNYEE